MEIRVEHGVAETVRNALVRQAPDRSEGTFAIEATITNAAWAATTRSSPVPFDYNGAPTLTLPCGLSSEGLPLALQLAGKPLAEPLLCRLGAAYEAATEWHDMHPGL